MIKMIQKSRQELGLNEGEIVLTFDDGPVLNQTPALLDLLAKENVLAAFCLVGRRVGGREEIVQRIEDEGHMIVNHGDRHIVPNKLTDEELQVELSDFDDRIAVALNKPNWTSDYYRPPGGTQSERLEKVLAERKLHLMPISYFAWDVFPIPLQRVYILSGLLRDMRINKGGLYLLHEATVPLSGEKEPAPDRDNRPWLIDLVKEFIQTAKAEGYQFVHPDRFRQDA